MGKNEDLNSVALSNDVLIWECPECSKLNRDKYKEDLNENYCCSCGFVECDIREFINDIEWGD